MDALSEARVRLLTRIEDPRAVMVPGLRDDLRAIVAAFDEIERRTATLAAVALRKHYWPQAAIHRAQLEALASMGAESGTVWRVAEHGERCLCAECMPGVG